MSDAVAISDKSRFYLSRRFVAQRSIGGFQRGGRDGVFVPLRTSICGR
jgi:hypothetical protein